MNFIYVVLCGLRLEDQYYKSFCIVNSNKIRNEIGAIIVCMYVCPVNRQLHGMWSVWRHNIRWNFRWQLELQSLKTVPEEKRVSWFSYWYVSSFAPHSYMYWHPLSCFTQNNGILCSLHINYLTCSVICWYCRVHQKGSVNMWLHGECHHWSAKPSRAPSQTHW